MSQRLNLAPLLILLVAVAAGCGAYSSAPPRTEATSSANSPTNNSPSPCPGCVAPKISTVTPSAGPAGTVVMLRGTGFAPANNQVTIKDPQDGQPSQTIPSLDSQDGQTLKFTIPTQWTHPCSLCPADVEPGDYAIYLTNDNGSSNSVTFTVTASKK